MAGCRAPQRCPGGPAGGWSGDGGGRRMGWQREGVAEGGRKAQECLLLPPLLPGGWSGREKHCPVNVPWWPPAGSGRH